MSNEKNKINSTVHKHRSVKTGSFKKKSAYRAAIKNNDDSKNETLQLISSSYICIHVLAAAGRDAGRCDLYNNEECTGMRFAVRGCRCFRDRSLAFGISLYRFVFFNCVCRVYVY